MMPRRLNLRRMRCGWPLTVALCLTAAACARIPAAPPAPAVLHPETGAPPQGAAFTAGDWPRQDWWRALGDPQLDRLEARALAGNPDLAAAAARLQAARAAVDAARSRLRPQVQAAAALAQQHFSATGEHSLLNGRSVLYGAAVPLAISYDVDLSGENGRRVAAAAGAARAAEAATAAARLQVTAAVADAWLAAAGYSAAVEAERRQLALERHLVALQDARLRAGLSDAGDRLAASQAEDELQVQIAADTAQRDVLLAAAAALAGQTPAATARLRPRPPALDRFAVPGDLPIGLLRRRPDVMAALWQVEAARQQVAAAKDAFYPRLNLALFAGWDSIHLGDLFDAANFAHSIGPTLTLPLFEGGALRAGLAGARAGYAAAVSAYNGRVLAAVQEVAAAVAQWRGDRAAMRQALDAAARARDRAHIRAVALHAGLSSGVPSAAADLEAAARDAAAARLTAAAGRSWVRLTAALGGGYAGTAPDGAAAGD